MNLIKILFSMLLVLALASCGGGSGTAGRGSDTAGNPSGTAEEENVAAGNQSDTADDESEAAEDESGSADDESGTAEEESGAIHTGFVSKGPVTGALCSLYGVTDGVKAALLASASRSEFGNIEFDAFSYEGLGLIECVGGTYIDEATGLSLTAPAMRAVVPIAEASRHIITPLTELAVSLAEIAGADLRTVVDKYNALIAVEFGLRDINIVNVFPDVSSSTQGRLYAMALAGLSHLDSAEDGTIAETLANLIADLELDEALSKEAKTAFAEALVEYSENDIGEISSILEEILEPSALSDPGVLNYSENAANSEFVFENAGGGLISACSSDALQNIGLNIAPTPDGSSCVINGTPNQVIPNRTYSITVTNVAGTSSVDVQVVITARFDAVEKALTDGHADDVSIEQLVNYIKEKNTEQVASCQAVVDVVYPSGAYPETDVIIDTSRSNNYASTIPENTVVQSSLNANITWVGKQENTNRYAVFGYNAFDYKDFPSTLGGSTTKILEWVLNLGEGVDIFSQPLVVVTNSGSAARDLNPWLATNAPGHRWTVTSDLSALNSGNYDLFFNIFGRGGESTLAHQQPLLTDQKPVIAYNADYIPGVEDLADFGLELIGRANDHYINLGLASQACANAAIVAPTVDNIDKGNVPSDFSLASCEGEAKCDYKNVTTVEGDNAYDAYHAGIDSITRELETLTRAGKNVFAAAQTYNILKAAVLLADKYRENVTYPMDVNGDAGVFSRAYFADHVMQITRPVQPRQEDIGVWGIESTSAQIAAEPKTASVTHSYSGSLVNNEFQSTQVYLLPGVSATIRRTDSSTKNVNIRVNILRETVKIWTPNFRYDAPKNIQSEPVEIESGKDYTISHAYGGPLYLQIIADGSSDEVVIEFQNVAQHPVLFVPASGINTTQARRFLDHINSSNFQIFDIVTESDIEIHVTRTQLEKTLRSLDQSTPDSYVVADLVEWINDFDEFLLLSNYVQYGTLDPILPGHTQEVRDFFIKLDARGSQDVSALRADASIHSRPRRQHINLEWQARCGSSCSGNPIDSREAIVPRRGYVISHEIGHNLQTRRTKIYGGASTEVSTNIFPYYALSAFYRAKGINDSGSYSRASMDFDEAYLAVQNSIAKNWPPGPTHPIWGRVDWQTGYESETIRRAF